RTVFLYPLDEIEAVAVRHAHVGQAKVGALFEDLHLGLAHARCLQRGESHALQRDGEQVADVRLVVDDEYARRARRGLQFSHAGSSWKRMRKQLRPSPSFPYLSVA